MFELPHLDCGFGTVAKIDLYVVRSVFFSQEILDVFCVKWLSIGVLINYFRRCD